MKRLLAVLLCVCGLPAAAAPELNLAVGADGRWFDWREYLDGRQLLNEIGPQLLLTGHVEWQQGPFVAALDTAWGGGFARYDGQLQNGEPYKSTAYETVTDTQYSLRWREARGEVGVAMLQRDWRRFIEGGGNVSSAEERFRWHLWLVGGEWRVHMSEAFEWRLALQAGEPFSRKEKVYFRTGEDTLELEPGQGAYVRLALPLRSLRQPALRIEPYYQQQRLARSAPERLTENGVPTIFQVFQPASIRRELGLALRWQFGVRQP